MCSEDKDNDDAAAFGEEEGGKKESEAVAVRDLEDGLNQGPKIIEMKQTGGWHRGRLQKTSNADQIMEQVKKGGNVVMDDEPARAPEASNFCGGDGGDISAADAARAALVKDALAERDRPEGEEKTLGLTIETGKAVSRALDSKDKKIDLEKIDLENCGEETKLTDYDAMPIAEFGMALMRGMGWKDGEALGGSRKGIIEPIDIKAQPEGLGLGAVPKAESPGRDKRGGKRFVPKPGQEKDHREEAKDRIRKEAAARLGSFEVGMKVAIISGRHRGLTGTISYSYAHEIMVTLTASGEEVTVDKKDLDSDVSKAHHIKTREEEERERQEEERQRRRAEDRDKARERSDRDRDRERDRERDRDRDRDRDVRDRGKAGGGGGREEAGAWLRPHIRVRIIDKDLKAGKYYLKKCRVLDVVGRGICTLQVEDTRYLLLPLLILLYVCVPSYAYIHVTLLTFLGRMGGGIHTVGQGSPGGDIAQDAGNGRAQDWRLCHHTRWEAGPQGQEVCAVAKGQGKRAGERPAHGRGYAHRNCQFGSYCRVRRGAR